MTTRLLCAPLAALAMLCAAFSANAQSKGRIVFVNATSGAVQWGGIDADGFFHVSQTGLPPESVIGVTQLIPTDSGILSYALATGQTNIITIEAAGLLDNYPQQGCCSAGWPIIVGLGNSLFFYDRQSTGAIVALDNSFCDTCPTLRQTKTLSLSAWSSVIATDNYLFFYQTQSGLFAVGFINRAGLFSQTEGGTGLPTGFTLVTSVGDNILLYDRGTGRYEAGAIFFTGNQNDFFDRVGAGTLPHGFTTAVQLNGNLLLYNVANGSLLIGHIVPTGNSAGFAITQQTNQPGWTNIIAAGQFLLFYNATTGKYKIAKINGAGRLSTKSRDSFAPGFKLVAATQQ